MGPRDPEESRQAELGAKLTFLGGKGFAGLALYDLRRENIAIPDSTGITRQDGDQRSRGVELDLTVEPSRGWSVQGNYAFTDSTLTSFSEIVQLQPPDFMVVDYSGNTAPFAPRHMFGLWVSKRFDVGLGLALGLRHVSDQLIAPDNWATIDAYTTLAARSRTSGTAGASASTSGTSPTPSTRPGASGRPPPSPLAPSRCGQASTSGSGSADPPPGLAFRPGGPPAGLAHGFELGEKIGVLQPPARFTFSPGSVSWSYSS